jgi:hypothetical protein
LCVEPDAGDDNVTCGAVVSIDHEAVAAPLVSAALSVAATWNVCAPSARPVYVAGLEHGWNEPLSSAQTKPVTFGSVSANVKDAFALAVVPVGPAEIVGVAIAVIDQLYVAGEPTLPARSVARTWNEWLPLPNPEYDAGLLQLANGDPSTLHSNPFVGSLALNAKVADDA